jgi:hypothetical protein
LIWGGAWNGYVRASPSGISRFVVCFSGAGDTYSGPSSALVRALHNTGHMGQKNVLFSVVQYRMYARGENAPPSISGPSGGEKKIHKNNIKKTVVPFANV